jgi:endonuclease-3
VQATFLSGSPFSATASFFWTSTPSRSRSRSNFVGMPVSTRVRGASAVVSPDNVVSSTSTPVSTRRRTRLSLEMTTEESSLDAPTPSKIKSTSPKALSYDLPAVVTPPPASTTSSSSSPDAIVGNVPVETEPTKKKRKKTPTAAPVPQMRAPDHWREIYSLVVELRQDRTSPCDHSGCEALPSRSGTPRDFRFQALMSLMLSSQTKDAIVGEAIRGMQADGCLDVESISQMTPEKLNSYIKRVGFHNNKTKYIKQVVEILKEEYAGDIPPTAAAMMELPGVGPKMAFICENVAWDKHSGIGVDTHMHRLFNDLGWVKSKNPEQTRVQLEAWLPSDKWAQVNILWVGFGQEVQQFKPKILRKALDCSRPIEALKLLKRCGLDYRKEGKKLNLEEEIAEALTGSNTAKDILE